jgi:Sec7-like guanine-nucleotide exchange factor
LLMHSGLFEIEFNSLPIKMNFFRRYLFTFILPGEAQKIDRIMEAFAQRYYECNPHIYATAGKFNKKKQIRIKLKNFFLFLIMNRSLLYCIICYYYVKYIIT